MYPNKDYNILLKKLISGTITDAERWSLEKASLDDPFLADAIEGIYDNDADVTVPMTIEVPAKVKSIYWYKRMAFAASFVLLLGLSYVVIQNIETEGTDLAINKEVSQHQVAESVADVEVELQEQAPATESVEKAKSNSLPNTIKNKVENINKSLRQKHTAPKPKEIEPVANSNKDENEIMAIVATDMAEDVPVPDEVTNMNAPAKSRQRESRKVEIETVPMITPQQIEGNVYDQEGAPINQAVVTSEHAMDTAITDANGFFSIAIAEQDMTIMAKSQGFTPVVLPVQPEVAFRLKKAQSSLSEESLLLVEMMNENELKGAYKKILDKEINRPFSLCPNEKKDMTIEMRIFISETGELTSLSIEDEVPYECQLSIENKIRLMAVEGRFKGKKAVSFYYKLK
jgi:hypothetical protein